MQRNYDYILKVCFIGESSVGKTALLKRYADDVFEEEMLSTIGVDFKFKYISGNVGRSMSWDHLLSCNCGTRLARKGSEALSKVTIKMPMP